jgi:uncharacterized protein YndB with AHSA1/START domain/DNA-binding transcriptional ArsR family regulator
VPGHEDEVFKALADPTRRHLLDRLRRDDGLTLRELCDGLGMARQSATQHLQILEAANLVTSVRRGREKVHHLNPVPIHEIQERWIDRFERPRLAALSSIKRAAEEHDMAEIPNYVYVTYIESTPDAVWHALTDADLTARYWGHSNRSDWQVGSEWQHVRVDGSDVVDVAGEVLEAEPPRRLVVTFDDPDPTARTGTPSRVTFTVDPFHEIVRLTVTHEDLPSAEDLDAISEGWPAVLANLKSLLETGHELSSAPWEMHAELRDRQMARHDA